MISLHAYGNPSQPEDWVLVERDEKNRSSKLFRWSEQPFKTVFDNELADTILRLPRVQLDKTQSELMRERTERFLAQGRDRFAIKADETLNTISRMRWWQRLFFAGRLAKQTLESE